MKRLLVLAIMAWLAGCAKPLEVASITEIKPPPGATGIDVYAERRRAGEQVPDFAGDQIVEVRTYAHPQDEPVGAEFPGADCKLSARDFTAIVKTPAKVRVPIYRAQSSMLAVSCEREGFKPKLVEVSAFNATKMERMQAASGGGAVGVIFMAAVNAASDPATHDFRYPRVSVNMEPVAPASPAKPERSAQAGPAVR